MTFRQLASESDQFERPKEFHKKHWQGLQELVNDIFQNWNVESQLLG